MRSLPTCCFPWLPRGQISSRFWRADLEQFQSRALQKVCDVTWPSVTSRPCRNHSHALSTKAWISSGFGKGVLSWSSYLSPRDSGILVSTMVALFSSLITSYTPSLVNPIPLQLKSLYMNVPVQLTMWFLSPGWTHSNIRTIRWFPPQGPSLERKHWA